MGKASKRKRQRFIPKVQPAAPFTPMLTRTAALVRWAIQKRQQEAKRKEISDEQTAA